MKEGSRVKIKECINERSGKTGTIIRKGNVFTWIIAFDERNISQGGYNEDELTVLGCPCNVKNCMKHSSKRKQA